MLGLKRVEANRIKTALEAEIKRYKDAIARQKNIEKQITVSASSVSSVGSSLAVRSLCAASSH